MFAYLVVLVGLFALAWWMWRTRPVRCVNYGRSDGAILHSHYRGGYVVEVFFVTPYKGVYRVPSPDALERYLRAGSWQDVVTALRADGVEQGA